MYCAKQLKTKIRISVQKTIKTVTGHVKKTTHLLVYTLVIRLIDVLHIKISIPFSGTFSTVFHLHQVTDFSVSKSQKFDNQV